MMSDPVLPPIEWLEGRFGIARLAPDAAVPAWAASGPFTTISRTPEELSILTLDSAIPADVAAERDFAAFRVAGQLDFAIVGLLAELTKRLAAAGISLFAVSTYDTDYVLVRACDLPAARAALGDE